jgi:signal transduction histidine kinase/DNA-binding response OmpR family regulator/ligand-binding sensor domain-containing protein
MQYKKIVLLLLLFTPLGIINVFPSQSYKPKIVEPITEFWRWQNFLELSGKGCQCMTEDKNGCLWFGINGGVTRYDGFHWKEYTLVKDEQDVSIVVMLTCSDGTIYAGSSSGVFFFKDEVWSKLPIKLNFGDKDDFPYNRFPIIELKDKSILIGSKKGVVQLKDGKMLLFNDKLSVQLDYANSDSKIEQVQTQSAFDVYSMTEDKNGSIWMALRDGRIYKTQINNICSLERIDNKGGYTLAQYPIIKITSSGKIIIVSGQNDGGININEGNSWRHLRVKKLFGIEEIQNDIIELADHSICVSGIGRVFILKNNTWKVYERPKLPFPSNRLRLFQTNGEKLWVIGLGNDVWRIDLSDKKWTTFTDLSFQAEEANGNKWFITVDGNVVKTDASMKIWTEYTKADGLIDAPVTVFITSKGEVFACGSDNNIAATAFYNGKNWDKQIHPKLSWGIDRRAILEARDGSLWFGTCSDFNSDKGQLGGFVKYTRVNNSSKNVFSFEYIPNDNDFRLYGVYGVGQTADDNIWAGQLGFYNYNPSSKVWKKITSPAGLGQNFVDCMQTAQDGNLWVGTRTNGLFFLDYKKGNWTQYTTLNGLSSNTILSILTLSTGNVWIATDRDVSHFDGKTWANSVFSGFIKFRRDGIMLKSTKDGSLWINQNPAIWFRKTQYGENLRERYSEDFKTVRYHPDNFPPETVITFSMDKVAQPGNVILSWNGNDQWKFTPSDQIQYSYRFDDEEWSAYSRKTSEIFLSLPSGSHTFEVRARNLDLNVDPTPAKVSFYVIPPITGQPWFILLIFSFLSIIASFIIYLYHRNKIIQELSETRARLFTSISHELRTPLTLIMGPLVKILKSVEIKPELKQPLSLMERNCQRLLRLINQILDYRKIEVGQLKFEPSKGDIVDFIREEFLSFSVLADSKKIDFRFRTTIDKLEIWFDPDKIEKIMFNLISNALKFTPAGKAVMVEIRHNTIQKEKVIQLDQHKIYKVNNWVELLVGDTGVGIPNNYLDKIFDNFFQVQNNSSTASGGTGIGLAVAREMVKIHFGEISVESALGIGTTFKVRIPLMNRDMIEGIIHHETINKSEFIKPVSVEKNEPDIPVNQTQTKNQKDKLLIIEDNADMRRYIRDELITEYNVEESIDGEEGFEKALSYGPDIIISDIMMPNMDGIELCRKIKTDERTSHIAVILLTARSSQESMINGLENGADDYLTKPFNREELLLRIHNMMETRKKIRVKFTKGIKVEPKQIAITSVDQKLMEKAIDIIEQHMDDSDFSVETFSSLIGMNRVSLYHKIKSLTNLSTREFFTVIRLKRSAQLLKESGMSVTEIAYQVGFKDPSHFSKLFKKQFGVSPKEFIKESEAQ